MYYLILMSAWEADSSTGTIVTKWPHYDLRALSVSGRNRDI